MKNCRIGILVLTLIFMLLVGACGTLYVQVEGTSADPGLQSTNTAALAPTGEHTPTGVTPEKPPASPRVEFTELGISLEVPADLNVIKEPQVDLNDSSKLAAYLFYIQNYGGNEGPGADYFQMYGHLQYDLPPESWEEFSQVQSNTSEYASINPIEINGARGFAGQFSGTRNRFIYMFYLDGRVLSIAVADPTPENKTLADRIIQSLQLLPDGLSDASHVKPVAEPAGYYQLLLPEDWNFTFQPGRGVRLSELEASSPDAELRVEETDGPHSNFYFQRGVFMSLVVLEDDSANLKPVMAGIESQQSVYFNGVEGTDYVFVEPSTAEGQLREVRIYHSGKSYLLRFSYASDANQDGVDRIIRSLTLPG